VLTHGYRELRGIFFAAALNYKKALEESRTMLELRKRVTGASPTKSKRAVPSEPRRRSQKSEKAKKNRAPVESEALRPSVSVLVADENNQLSSFECTRDNYNPTRMDLPFSALSIIFNFRGAPSAKGDYLENTYVTSADLAGTF